MVLYYAGTQEDRSKDLEKILAAYGQQLRKIDDAALEQTLDELVSSPDAPVCTGQYTYDPFLFFTDLDRESITRLQQDLKAAGIRIDHKAVKTADNASWKLETLLKEVAKEAAWFKKRERLYDLVTHPDMKKLQEDEMYAKTMATAYAILRSEKADENMIDLALQAVEEYSG